MSTSKISYSDLRTAALDPGSSTVKVEPAKP